MYFLDFREDDDYVEGDNISIEELAPIVTRRKDLDLTDDEVEELEKFRNRIISINELSKKLMDKVLMR